MKESASSPNLQFLYYFGNVMRLLVQRIFEAMHLKQIKHEGMRMIGVQFPDSVAEHSLVVAQIGRYLAVLEGVDPYRVVAMCVFHDLPETRLGDLHRVATRYLAGKHDAEMTIIQEQTADLPGGDTIKELFTAYETTADREALIAKDADYLEQAFQAKIFLEQGYSGAHIRIENVSKALKTDSAKRLLAQMQEGSSTDWRQDLQQVA